MFVTQAITTSVFRSVLERALVRLPSSTRDARELVYRRARESLVSYMRAGPSPATEDRIRDEIRRLEEVIRQVEAEFDRPILVEEIPLRGREGADEPAGSLPPLPNFAPPMSANFRPVNPVPANLKPINLRAAAPSPAISDPGESAPAPAPADLVGESSGAEIAYSATPASESVAAENYAPESPAEPTPAAPAPAEATSAEPSAAEPSSEVAGAADPNALEAAAARPSRAGESAANAAPANPSFMSLVPRRGSLGDVDDEDSGPKSGALVSRREPSPPRVPGKVGRGLDLMRGAVQRQFETPDPTLPAILEFQRPSAAILNAPMPALARGITWIVTSMVVAMIVLSGAISVDQVVTSRGIVVSRTPTLLVQPLETAIVKSIDVSEGEWVKAGQILAHLDPTFTSADVGALTAQVTSLTAEVARLQAEAGNKPFLYSGSDPDWLLQESIFGHRQAEFQLKIENYKHKLDELNATIAKAQADILGYNKREEVAQNVEGIRKELEARQLGSRLNTLAATDARAEMERAAANAQDELQSAKRDKEALQSESDSFAQNWSADVSQKLSEAGRKLSDVREELNKANRRSSLVELKAEKDGIVQSLAKVSVGSVLQSGQPFITLVPSGAELEVETNIPGSEAGFAHDGDPVAIKFDTFPFSQYGMAEGVCARSVPAASRSKRKCAIRRARRRSSARASLIIARAFRSTRSACTARPPGFRVTPGMPVTTDIKVGRRTILSYFLGRVLPIAREGLREPQG